MINTLHPWHGIELLNKNDTHNSFIEICPNDGLKYELCKKTGLLKVNRPQHYSNSIPCLYGFLPKTYSGKESAKYCEEKSGRKNLKGDKDPVDICVFTNFEANNGIIVKTKIIGGLRMIDGGEVDDKLIGVLHNDPVYGKIDDISNFEENLLKILKHYFLTYKGIDNKDSGVIKKVEILGHFGREEALEVLECGVKDYNNKFVVNP